MEPFKLGLTLLIGNLCGFFCIWACRYFIRHTTSIIAKTLSFILIGLLSILLVLSWISFPYLSGLIMPESGEAFLALGLNALSFIALSISACLLAPIYIYYKTRKIKTALFAFVIFCLSLGLSFSWYLL